MEVYVGENEEEMDYEEYRDDVYAELSISFYDTECDLVEKRTHQVEVKTIQSVQNERAVECLKDVHKVLADAIIEITEPLDKLDFYDLEKIARCFEAKIDLLIAELKGEKK